MESDAARADRLRCRGGRAFIGRGFGVVRFFSRPTDLAVRRLRGSRPPCAHDVFDGAEQGIPQVPQSRGRPNRCASPSGGRGSSVAVRFAGRRVARFASPGLRCAARHVGRLLDQPSSREWCVTQDVEAVAAGHGGCFPGRSLVRRQVRREFVGDQQLDRPVAPRFRDELERVHVRIRHGRLLHIGEVCEDRRPTLVATSPNRRFQWQPSGATKRWISGTSNRLV